MRVCTSKGYRTSKGRESYQGNRCKSLSREALEALRCADVVVFKKPSHRRDGGTGRRNGLKIRRPSGHGGSTPPPGTTSPKTISSSPRKLDWCRRLEGVHSRLSSFLAVLFLAVSSTAQTPQPVTAEKSPSLLREAQQLYWSGKFDSAIEK